MKLKKKFIEFINKMEADGIKYEKKKLIESKRSNDRQLQFIQEDTQFQEVPNMLDAGRSRNIHPSGGPYIEVVNSSNKSHDAAIEEGGLGYSRRSHNRGKASSHRVRMNQIREYYNYENSMNYKKERIQNSYPSKIMTTTKNIEFAASGYPNRSSRSIGRNRRGSNDSSLSSSSKYVISFQESPQLNENKEKLSQGRRDSNMSHCRNINLKISRKTSIRDFMPFRKRKHNISSNTTMDTEQLRIIRLNQKIDAIRRIPSSISELDCRSSTAFDSKDSECSECADNDVAGDGNMNTISSRRKSRSHSSRRDSAAGKLRASNYKKALLKSVANGNFSCSRNSICSSIDTNDEQAEFGDKYSLEERNRIKETASVCSTTTPVITGPLCSLAEDRLIPETNHSNNPCSDSIRNNNKNVTNQKSVVVIDNQDQHYLLKKSASSTAESTCTETEDSSSSSYIFDDLALPSSDHRVLDELEQDSLDASPMAIYLKLYNL